MSVHYVIKITVGSTSCSRVLAPGFCECVSLCSFDYMIILIMVSYDLSLREGKRNCLYEEEGGC